MLTVNSSRVRRSGKSLTCTKARIARLALRSATGNTAFVLGNTKSVSIGS